MSELKTLLLNVTVALAVFIGGVEIHRALGLGSWFVPLSLLPFFMWLWWRGALPGASLSKILLLCAAFTAYIAIKDAAWQNPPDWSHGIDALFGLALLCGSHSIIGWWSDRNRRFTRE